MSKAELSLETILKDTIWIAKMAYGRFSGTYDELKQYRNSEDCRDFDLCRQQPKHLEVFYGDYFKHIDEHGSISLFHFYEIWSKQKEV